MRLRGLLPLFIISSVLHGFGAVPAFALDEVFTEDAPAYNDIVARSFLIEVEPLVEKYTGWECEWPVAFQLVSRVQYINESIKEAAKDLAKTDPTLDLKRIEAELAPMLAAQSIGLLGRYSVVNRKIYFLPGNLPSVMRSLGVERHYTRDLIEVIMAHELTHAVQDSRYNIFDKLMNFKSKDERAAWVMLVEGHATWVQERVAADLGLAESAQRFAAQMLKKHKQVTANHREEIAEDNVRGYLDGKKFVEAVYAKGGIKAVQDLFEKPPTSPGEIEDPEVFFARQARK